MMMDKYGIVNSMQRTIVKLADMMSDRLFNQKYESFKFVLDTIIS